MQRENEKDQVQIFQYTYSESSQIHQQAKMYCFNHTNHDIHLNVLLPKCFKFMQTLFLCLQSDLVISFVTLIFHVFRIFEIIFLR